MKEEYNKKRAPHLEAPSPIDYEKGLNP